MPSIEKNSLLINACLIIQIDIRVYILIFRSCRFRTIRPTGAHSAVPAENFDVNSSYERIGHFSRVCFSALCQDEVSCRFSS